MYNLLKKDIFLFQTDKDLNESLHMFDTQKPINEKCDSICCAKKQDDGAQHEPKQSDLMRCGDLHLRIQDIMETSVRFDEDTNKLNV